MGSLKSQACHFVPSFRLMCSPTGWALSPTGPLNDTLQCSVAHCCTPGNTYQYPARRLVMVTQEDVHSEHKHSLHREKPKKGLFQLQFFIINKLLNKIQRWHHCACFTKGLKDSYVLCFPLTLQTILNTFVIGAKIRCHF